MSNPGTMKGRDISAPVQHVVFNGKRYPMIFNNRAARITEDIYSDVFGRDIGYYGILNEVAVPKHRAIMAVVFAGIVAAGADVTWEDFDENFKLSDVEGVTEAIRKGMIESLPDDDPDADDSEAKNTEATPMEM